MARRKQSRRFKNANRQRMEALEARTLLSAGPIFNYRFDQPPAFNYQSVADSAGNTNATFFATNNGHADITNNGFPVVVPGATPSTGTAWSFPRNPAVAQAEVDVPNTSIVQSMGNVATTTGLSIGFWVNDAYQAADNGMTLMNSGSVNVSATTVGTAGQMKFVLGNNQVTATTSIASGTLDGTWHHVLLTADFTQTTNNVHLYVDGALDPASGTLSHTFSSFTNTFTSGNDLWIFSDRNKANHWIGAADDLVVYTRPVTAAEVTEIYAHGSDAAPNDFAGAPQTVAVNQAVGLNGAAINQGNSAHKTLSDAWTQISGPAPVTFVDATQPNTSARFPVAGTYVLQMSSTDGLYASTSQVTDTVVANTPPVVTTTSAMPAIVLPTTTLNIGGTVTDDGNPYGTLKTTWSLVSGPAAGGSVSFANANAVNTTATFTAAGRYTLQLSASDGAATASSRLQIEVYPAGTGGNQIVVDGGGAHESWASASTVNLAGSYWNTNKPVTETWSVAANPSGGQVTFGNASSLNTTATFSAPGVYTLQLNVTDGTLSGASTSIVQVYPDGNNFGGNSIGFLNHYFNTSSLGLTYDYTGFNAAGFSAPGAAYSHPRILMSASDVPGLVNRLQNTTVGQIAFQSILNSISNNLTNTTATYYTMYNDLAGGSAASFVSAGRPFAIVAALAYDAFAQMVNYAAAAPGSAAQAAALAEGQKVGAALASIGADSAAQIAADNNADWQNSNINYTYRDMLAFAYDYGYGFMTAAQQNTVRGALIAAVSNQWSIGMDTLPSYQSNSSNWVPMIDSALLINVCGVEGETATDAGNVPHVSDPTVYPRVEAALQKWYAVGMFSDGSMYEGMGKGQLYAQALVALAKRGDMLIAATSAKYNIQQLLPASMEPYGYQYTWDEYLGGSSFPTKDADVPVLKYAFPSDPVIDFQYRNDLGPDYSRIDLGSGQPNLGFSITSDELLIRATLAMDYNTSLTYTQAQALAGSQLPLTYTSNDRGLLIAKSDWTSNAAQLYFQPRSEPGGHSVPDRNTFTYSALGQNWVPYIGDITTPANASIVTVDGKGPSTMPAAVVADSDTPNATFMTGNATQAYTTGQGGTSTLAQWNYNQFQLYPSDPAWGDLPVWQLPQWDTNGQSSGVTWAVGAPYQNAYRTAGLVRGANPYALITDNIQKDTASHLYTWQMAINDSVTVTVQPPTADQPYYDMILTDAGAGTNLLVRMLSFTGATPAINVSPTQGAFTFNYKMLTFSTQSVAPEFKVMLYAFKDGEALPTTTWNGNVLTVVTPGGQTDQVSYNRSAPTGPTQVVLNRLASAAAQALPAVSIIATNPAASAAASDTGLFTVTRTGSTAASLVVRYTVSGSAVPGTDYTALSGLVTIPAGASSATIAVNANGSATFNSASTVTVTLGPENTYTLAGSTAATSSAATVTIAGANAGASSALGALSSIDIGAPAMAGSASLANGVFTIKGGGSGVGISTGATTSSDQFQFDYQPLSGDGTIIARVNSVSNTNGGAKGGVMIRNDTTDPAAVFAYMEVDANGNLHFIDRATQGGTVSTAGITLSVPYWVKLVRAGSTFTAYYSIDGAGWTQLGSATITMATPAYAGLAVTATNSAALCTSVMDEVSINGNGVNAAPTVSIAAGSGAIEASPVVGGTAVVTRDNAFGDLLVSYTVGGTAVAGTDYAALPGTVLIPAGQNVAIIPITPIGAAAAGSAKTVVITLTGSSSYALGSAVAATVSITESGTNNGGIAPVVWYPMDQTPTRTANAIIDATGHTSGTISSGTGVATVVSGATSATGNAWNFGRTGAAITVPGSSPFLQSLGNVNRTTGLAVGFWLNLNYVWNSDNNNSIFSLGKIMSGSSGQDTTNHTYLNLTLGSISLRATHVMDGNWHFVVMSEDFTSAKNNVTFYLDGVQDEAGYLYNVYPSYSHSFANSFTDPSNPNLVISSAFKGALDEFMIFNSPVTPTQVQTLYATTDHPFATINAIPGGGATPSATIIFSSAVTGLTASAFTLTRDGVNVPLTGATLSTTDNITYTLGGLSSLTASSGQYVLSFNANSAIKNAQGNAVTQNTSAAWSNWAAPSLLTATAAGPGSINLSWTSNSSSQTSFQVQRSLDGVSNWLNAGSTPGTVNTFSDTGLADGTQYFYRVYAASSTNMSANSNSANAVTSMLAPSLATVAQQPNVVAVNITWINNASSATSIRLDRSIDNGGSWQNIAVLASTAAQYVDTKVSVGGNYLYRIESLNSVATSAEVVSGNVTLIAPVAPTVATAASASPTSVTGTTANLSVLGADAGGESNLIYTWSATGPAPVAFSYQGVNYARNDTATFAAAGAYNLTVTIKNAAGLTTTSKVSVTVVSTLTALSITPVNPTIPANSTQPLSVSGADQFGSPVSVANPVWSILSGAGAIQPSGLFTAPPVGGTTVVQAAAGGVPASVRLTIQNNLGIFTSDGDIGSPSPAGSASYNPSGSVYTVSGGGSDIYGSADQFNFVSKAYSGNVTLVTQVTSLANTNTWAKAGLMIRDTSAANSAFVDLVLSYSSGVSFQWRSAAGGGSSNSTTSGIGQPAWLKLVRSGSSYTAFYATTAGTPSTTDWKQVGGAVTVSMGSSNLVGLAVTSHNNGTATTATLTNLTITGVAQTPAVAIAAAASPNPAPGSTVSLSVLGADNGGESGLTYTWTATGPGSVNYSGATNGTNASKNLTATVTVGGQYTFTATIANSGGQSITSQVSVSLNGANAAFTGIDTTTQGTWGGVYGSDGYFTFNGVFAPPAYVQIGYSGGSGLAWSSLSSDPRAEQATPTSSARIAFAYITSTSETLDLNFTDGQTHQVALYAVDLDNQSRNQTFTLTDAATGVVLDTRTISNFSGGEYLRWNLSGHVLITLTANNGTTAVGSALLFDPVPATARPALPANLTAAANGPGSVSLSWTANTENNLAGYNVYRATSATGPFSKLNATLLTSPVYADSSAPNAVNYYRVVAVNTSGVASVPATAQVSVSGSTALFTGIDTTTQGTWGGVYGSDGYFTFNGVFAPPAYVQIGYSGGSGLAWSSLSSDPRAEQATPTSSARIAFGYATSTSETFDLNFTDGQTHQVALYAVDLDNQSRNQTFTLTDAATGVVLDTRTISNFSGGDYLRWNLSGHVLITLTANNGTTAVASALLFGPPT